MAQFFDDAWRWSLRPSLRQPETLAAILLAVVAKRIVWNNFCKLTHSRNAERWPTLLKRIKQSYVERFRFDSQSAMQCKAVLWTTCIRADVRWF